MSSATKLFIWRYRSLFLSTIPIKPRRFTAAADQLFICLQGEIRVRTQHEGDLATGSVLLRAGTVVEAWQADPSDAIVAVCFLNPIGQDYHVAKEFMTAVADDALIGHQNEKQIIAQLRHIRDNPVGASDAYRFLDQLLVPTEMQDKVLHEYDPRIVQVLRGSVRRRTYRA